MTTCAILRTIFVLAATGILGGAARAAKPASAELRRAHAWVGARFGDLDARISVPPPFSFVYGGRPSREFLDGWDRNPLVVAKLGKSRLEHRLAYTDPETGLEVRCVAVEYRDFPTVEWTLTFKNTGKTDTPIVSDVRPMDLSLARAKPEEFKLHWNTADNCTQDSYAPHLDAIGPNAEFKSASAGGRPTTGGYPYWNVEYDGGGCVAVLSWAGQWSADFKRDDRTGFQLRAGQELTHFTLHPGEEVSSPTAIVQLYDGDWIRAQNIWRRWMLAYNLPRVNGKPVKPFTYGCDGDFYPGLRTNLEGERASISRFCAEKLTPDSWDQDAGWYPCRDQWWDTGDWQPDTQRFPGGMKALSDFLHERGIKLMLWFEPERAAGGTLLPTTHPDWFYGGANGGLLKLGEPAVWKWVVEHFDNLIATQGVDIYRQDFNIDPLASWRANDAENRQGITEIRHVEGYYAYWDELRRRHPGLLIDTCASGGRRNCVETLRRAVPVLRSDYTVEPIGNQGHTYGLSMWVPFYGTGQYMTSAYALRSCMCPIFGIGGDVRKNDLNWDLGRKSAKEWALVSRCMLGDYYPLTPYSLAKTDWIAWQFDLPEKGEGIVAAFRREEAPGEALLVTLRGLDAGARYAVENLDTGKSEERRGSDLMKGGISVDIAAKPGSAILHYRKTR